MKNTVRTLGALCLIALLALTPCFAQNFPGASGNPSVLSRSGGTFYAPAFFWQSGRIISGNTSTGSATITVVGSTGGIGGVQVPDGTTIPLQTAFSTALPLIVDWGQGAAEYITPTAVSVGTCPAGNLGVGGTVQCATITASFSNTHGQSGVVVDGTFGVQTAINYANSLGGGIVSIDAAWNQMAASISSYTNGPANGPNGLLSGLVSFASVAIEDLRGSAPQFWSPQGGLTTLAAPTTLTATTVGFGLNGANTTAGTYTGTSTYNTCIAYVDIYGQEGPCSTAFSSLTAGTGSTNQIGFSAPAASTGAVGYTVYISLASGGSTLQYKVPLATYVGGVLTGNGVCTLTKVELTTAACAVANTTYGQSGSTAQVSALTLNTSPVQPLSTTVSTTSIYVPNAGGRTTYVYVPGSHLGTPGIPMAFLPFAISAADATTVPSVLGTVNLPPNFMNYLGRTIEVCGKATTSASTATIASIQFQWDAIGQNTAGKGVVIGNLGLTPATAFATTAVYTFCEDFQTTVTGTTATAGSINTVGGFLNTSGVATAAAGQGASSDPTAGATASLNLNSEARLNVIYVHTTGTDGTALTLQSLTVKVLN